MKAPGIKKTILLSTSDRSRILASPAKVTWKSIQNEEDVKTLIANRTKSFVNVTELIDVGVSQSTIEKLADADAFR